MKDKTGVRRVLKLFVSSAPWNAKLGREMGVRRVNGEERFAFTEDGDSSSS